MQWCETVRACAQAVNQSSRHLSSRADELLLLRRIGSGELGMPKHAVDLKGLARETIAVCGAQAEEESLAVRVEVPEEVPTLVSNRLSLKLVLS